MASADNARLVREALLRLTDRLDLERLTNRNLLRALAAEIDKVANEHDGQSPEEGR